MEEAVERFIAAAVCLGYCHDSGRSDLADRIQDDLWKHYHACRPPANDTMPKILHSRSCLSK